MYERELMILMLKSEGSLVTESGLTRLGEKLFAGVWYYLVKGILWIKQQWHDKWFVSYLAIALSKTEFHPNNSSIEYKSSVLQYAFVYDFELPIKLLIFKHIDLLHLGAT